MNRLGRQEVCEELGLSPSAFAERCRKKQFISAKQDRPRGGWSVKACCVIAEKAKEICGLCTGELAQLVPVIAWRVIDGAVHVDEQRTSRVVPEALPLVLQAVALRYRQLADELLKASAAELERLCG